MKSYELSDIELLDNVTDKETSIILSKIIKKLNDIKSIIDNPNRNKIMKLVRINDNLSITEISEKIGLSYQNTFNHIKILEEYGLVQRKKQLKLQGQVVYVNWTKKEIKDIIKVRK